MSKVTIQGDASGTGTFTIASPNSNNNRTLTLPDEAGTVTTSNSPYLTFRNRIINGAMVIDQRNAGASVTPTGGSYTLDRWRSEASAASKYSVQQNAGSVTPPTGFSNYLGVTSLSAYSVGAADEFLQRQNIEGFNFADLGWGTASAQVVTLSFWVRSSLTGTFGGSLQNSATSRNYPFTYTISAANTWEQKSVTIAGDTSGTWVGATNGVGVRVNFGLGVGSTYSGTAGAWTSSYVSSATGATSVVGTNGATFYITGVQLEKGSTATSFDYRPYGTELALCQRYYYRATVQTNGDVFGTGYNNTTSTGLGLVVFPVTMRSNPTALEQNGTAGNYNIGFRNTSVTCTSVPVFSRASANSGFVVFTAGAVFTAGEGCRIGAATTSAFLAWSAEL